jgi:hypothetical protein
MNLTEGLLIVIIIVLIITIVMRGKAKGKTAQAESNTRQWDCVDKKTGDTTSVKMQYSGDVGEGLHGVGCKCPKCSQAAAVNKGAAEMFVNCQGIGSQQALHEMCGDDDKFTFAINEFGGPGMEYKDWVASAAVGPEVVKMHAEFVKDRLGSDSQNITGRTWAVPDDIEVDQVPWQGLRRPQAVAVCNPTQVPDTNYNWYQEGPRFTWKSS